MLIATMSSGGEDAEWVWCDAIAGCVSMFLAYKMRICKIAAMSVVAVLALDIAAAPKAEAAYIVTLEQIGTNVVATGSGSLDLSALTSFSGGSINSIFPAIGYIELTDVNVLSLTVYTGLSGPESFGSGDGVLASSATNGEPVGIEGGASLVVVPDGYVSGMPLGTSAITFDSTTLLDLGVTDGTYVWTWGSGSNADSFTLYAEATSPSGVPEPATLVLLTTGLVGLTLSRLLNAQSRIDPNSAVGMLFRRRRVHVAVGGCSGAKSILSIGDGGTRRKLAWQPRSYLAALGCGALLALGLPGAPSQATPMATCGGPVTCFSESGSIEAYQVTTSGLYDITAWGAQGGASTFAPAPGDGAETGGEFNLAAGTMFEIAVGQQGQGYSSIVAGGGGGGGSFVVEIAGTGEAATPLVIAGGGGGAGGGSKGTPGGDGQAGQNGTTGGNVNGEGGGAPVPGGFGGYPGSGLYGAGGGGFNSVGGGNESQLTGGGGGDFFDGLYGGEGANGASSAFGGSNGGFGGGGGGGYNGGGGGGGGYGGGGGGGGFSNDGEGIGGGGGGGGSYLDEALVLPGGQIDLGGVNTGDGLVTFDLIQAAAPASVTEPGTLALLATALVGCGALRLRRRAAA